LNNEGKFLNGFTFPCLQDAEIKAAREILDSSSQGSTEPWDTTFNKATNAFKGRPKSLPPTSAGRISGLGTSTKFREYYHEEAKKRKERRSQSAAQDQAEKEELKRKIAHLEKSKVDQDEVNAIVQQKILELLPARLMEGIAKWNAVGQVGPIEVPSAGGSTSSHQVSPKMVTPPASIPVAKLMELYASELPPPVETTKTLQPAAAVLPNAPEPEKKDRPAAARVSTLAQLNAITKVIN
jgi:hypothetical protein